MCVYAFSYIHSMRKRGISIWRAIVLLGRSAAYTGTLLPLLCVATVKGLMNIKERYRITPKASAEVRVRASFTCYLHEFLFSLLLIITISILLFEGLIITALWLASFLAAVIYTFTRNIDEDPRYCKVYLPDYLIDYKS